MKKRLIKSAVFITFAAFLTQGNLTSCPAQDWEDLKAAAKSVSTIKADFRQIRRLEILNAPLISRGIFYYEVPDLLRWEYSFPLRNVMLKQGESIRVYQFRGGGWKRDSNQALEVRGMIFAEINRWLRGRFEETGGFTPSFSAGPPVGITLTPRDEFKRFLRRIELVFSERPGIIRSVEIIESEKAKTRIEFMNIDINIILPAGIFEKP
jgi:outer membrane lipoprotein carrier protein